MDPSLFNIFKLFGKNLYLCKLHVDVNMFVANNIISIINNDDWKHFSFNNNNWFTLQYMEKKLFTKGINEPPGPFRWPIIGSFLTIRGKLRHHVAMEMYQKYGPIFKLQIGERNTVYLAEHDIIKEVFVEKGHIVEQRFPNPRIESVNKGFGLIMGNGEYHKKVRGEISTFFTATKFKRMENEVYSEIDLLCQSLKEDSSKGQLSIEPHKYIKSCTVNIIFRLIFGKGVRLDYGGNETSELSGLIRNVVASGGLRYYQDYFPYIIPIAKRVSQFLDDVSPFKPFHTYAMQLVRERLQVYDGSTEPTNLLEEYIVKYKKGEIELDAIGFIVVDMVLAGTDSSANTILFVISSLCDNPDIQDQLYNELIQVIGRDRLPNINDKPNLPYTNAVIKETLRRFSLFPLGIAHIATEDVNIRGYTIRKGDEVIQNQYSTGLSTKEWDNPKLFNPSRFINNELSTNKNKIVFGCGPRVCPGMAFAESEIFMIIATLFKSFKFKSDKPIGDDSVYGITLTPISYQNEPPGPFKWPIFGNFLMMVRKPPHLLAQDLYFKYGPVFKMQFGDYNTIFLTEYDVIKEAFVDNAGAFASRFPRPSRQKENKGLGIVTSNGEYSKNVRSVIGSFVSNTTIKKMENNISSEIGCLCDALKEEAKNGLVAPHQFIKTCALNIILRVLFGDSLHCNYNGQETNEVVGLIHEFFRAAGYPLLQDYFPSIPSKLDGIHSKIKAKLFLKSYKELNGYIEKVIRKRMETFDGKSTEPTDLLEETLVRHYRGEFQLESIVYMMTDLILTGTDTSVCKKQKTSANTILFTISALCDDPLIQKICCKELDGVLGDRLPTLADKSNLPYANAIIKESLRRFSVAPLGVPHIATEDTEIRGYTIRKGDQIIQNLYATGLSPKEWNNPEVFDPSRFLNNDSNKYKTVFGCGPRVCLGMSLAESELFLITTTLIKTFKFSSDKPIGTNTIFGVTLSPVPYQVIIDTR
ncbi:cytochrome P450 family protein [Cavenderia fasciculata]|uniref:Cytochrome P450 family protein n=1 Tax=Cavenderia fasciculata TaxID=261658 RepID=F4PVZ7_CACFS|nr:cytochrome P450 family protein [Cavenderia fasciculata]EGG20161.1 cytochrome P450 family protein [Cavenderia fasciculata]|eukprot:XP_004367144.1 cytochrome P450 family protein [Cavenderia fasciculata]